MKAYLKPLVLGCLFGLPLVTAASADPGDRWNRKEMREQRKEARKEYRDAVRNGDWHRAQDQYRELQQNRRTRDDRYQRYNNYNQNYIPYGNYNRNYVPYGQYNVNQYNWNSSPYYPNVPYYPYR